MSIERQPERGGLVRLVVFPGGFNWPVWVAQEYGWFERRGIDLCVTDTPGSVFQLSELIEGRFDLAITLIDNVVAYREGQGQVPLVGHDLTAMMAADTRVLPALVTAPDVKTYADLRGRTVSVDAMTTGYANVLYAMLEGGGLAPGDYGVESVGGVLQRFEALRAGKQAGALFNSPFEGLLAAEGFNLLDTAASAVGRYQGQVLAGRSGWARENRGRVVGFIEAFLQAVRWLYEPANRSEALEIFVRRQAGATLDSAKTAHDVLFHPTTGFPPDGRFDVGGVEKVVELRRRYGVPAKRIEGRARDYCDESFLNEAMPG